MAVQANGLGDGRLVDEPQVTGAPRATLKSGWDGQADSVAPLIENGTPEPPPITMSTRLARARSISTGRQRIGVEAGQRRALWQGSPVADRTITGGQLRPLAAAAKQNETDVAARARHVEHHVETRARTDRKHASQRLERLRRVGRPAR